MASRKWVERVEKIVVRMPNWLGDLVMATPVLEDLRARWPNAHIAALCQGGIGTLLEHNPYIDEVLTYTKPNALWRRVVGRGGVAEVRQGEYDLGVLLTNSFSTAWILWRGGVKHLIGYGGNMRTWMLSEAPSFPAAKDQMHLVDVYKELLAPLGISSSDSLPQLFVSAEEREWARGFLAGQGRKEGEKVVGINPAAAYGSAKQWLPQRFREVAQRLLAEGVRVLFVGDGRGVELVEQIMSGLTGAVSSAAGRTTLRQLVALIDGVDLFLTNDSGPMHVAAACGTPLVALFGSTCDVRTGPYGSGSVIHKHVECSPCYKRECPIDFRCMTRISADEVFEKVMHHLSE